MKTDNFRRRKIDFHIRGLSLDVRQEIFRKIDNINSVSVGYLLEKPEGYPHFKRLKYATEETNAYFQNIKARFDEVNAFMIAHGRYPLFSNTEDSYLSAVEYTEIMRMRPLPELEEEFGCSFLEYVPPVYTGDGSN